MICNSTRCSRIFEVGGGWCYSQLVNSKPTLSLCLDFVTFMGFCLNDTLNCLYYVAVNLPLLVISPALLLTKNP